MGKSRKDKVATSPKKPSKKRTEAKPPPEDDNQEDVTVCKDYVSMRWETTEQGQLAVWQVPEDDEDSASLSTLHGVIVSVKYDKTCALVFESEGNSNQKKAKKTVCYTCKIITRAIRIIFCCFFAAVVRT